MSDVTPASEFASAEHGLLWMASQYEHQKARADRAEAEAHALRERLTLTDEEREMCRVLRRMAGDPRGDRCTGSDVRELLAIINRLTGEATDG